MQWSPDFEASCIEAAIYGATLAEATLMKLKEKSRPLNAVPPLLRKFCWMLA
ncbi:MAG: hypothetical protein HC920_19005 [Oscillatoriales cyanobacterium SM2_3_0]|nr:hypothetical protein [Oscillatoriales cyanobacterium SM2_3_0]